MINDRMRDDGFGSFKTAMNWHPADAIESAADTRLAS